MEERAGQAGIPGGGGASPPAGPHGGLHGAEAWHWHRQEAYMDARHSCPWCAPCDDGRPGQRRRRRDAEIDAMIARIDGARAAGQGHWHGWAWPWPRAHDPWRYHAVGSAQGPGGPPRPFAWAGAHAPPPGGCQLYNRGAARAAP